MSAAAAQTQSAHVTDPAIITEIDSCSVLAGLDAGDVVLVDVRETVEYEAEHIPGAMLCPLSTFEPELFPKFPGKQVIIHCAVGKRSAAACKQLQQAGYAQAVLNLAGGIGEWKAAGCPTEVQPEDRKDIPFLEGAEPQADASPLQAGAHPGHILRSEFMAPFGLSAKSLAIETGVPASRISAIVRGARRITPETALRLARHLCTTEEFWLRLQSAHDLEIARREHGVAVNQQVKPRRTGTVVRVSAAKGCS
jgi:addiction module HigA family antidote